MGYITKYLLSVYNEEKKLPDDIDDLNFDDVGDILAATVEKWYTYDIDMKRYSKKHPEITFLLEGQGENSEDLWRCYFKNGKMFHTDAKIIYEEYDESKLK